MELFILLLATIGAQAIRFDKSMKINLVRNVLVSIFEERKKYVFLLLSFRALSCPNYCPKTIEPVCGEDGKIYR